MPTITVLEADGVTQTDVEVLALGRAAAAVSKSLALCTEDKAAIDAMVTDLAALEVLLTSIDADTAATVIDLAAIELLLDSIDTQLSAGTTAVSAASLPLPAGAATAAGVLDVKNAIDAQGIDAGTIGVPSTDVISVQSPVGNAVSGRAAITDGASTQVLAAAGASIKNCVTTIIVSNSSATAAEVNIRDGTAGTVLMTIPAPANKAGAVISLPTPLVGSANTIMAADPDAALSTITVSMVGFTSQ